MENRASALRAMHICRFCLTEEEVLTNIYERGEADANKQAVPLPLQLMACVAIEVFENDGMPQMICKICRSQTLQAYTFKTNCKKADDAFKVYLATGTLTKPWTQEEMQEQMRAFHASKRNVEQSKGPDPKRLKTEDGEMITLNYSTNFGGGGGGGGETANTSQSAMVEDDYDEEDSQDESQFDPLDQEFESGEDKARRVNPTLKVNQVKTDCYPCPHCDRSFPLKQLLELHVANHARERNYACDECEKSFFTKYDLNKHMSTHTVEKPFSCVVCQKSFSRETLLHRHEKVHNDAPKYLCIQCDKTFLTGEDLDAHAVKHKKKKPFLCKICHKSFVFKQGLERHLVTHGNSKPHKCNYCEASFTSAIKLTRHVTSHAGLRPYPCKICGRTFLLSHHLTRHMRSHFSSQDFMRPLGQHKCDICSMSFRRKDSLINHSAIHSMVNLKCVICNTGFDNVNKVKAHITTHLSDLPFPCEKCDYSFDTQEQLEDHEVKHAEMEYEDQIEQEVMAEARKAAEVSEEANDVAAAGGDERTDESDEEEEEDDNVAEFTITNDLNNPELVRRSKRVAKVKNYADFLKDELGSEVEEDQNVDDEEEEDELIIQDQQQENGQSSSGGAKVDKIVTTRQKEEDVIKPIVRVEGTKVYARKSGPGPERKVAPSILNSSISMGKDNNVNVSQAGQASSFGDSGKEPTLLNSLPQKEIYKIGDKTVMVQKILVTKEQMKAMAREGKIEKKGNTLLLKKSPGQIFHKSLDSIFSSTPTKPTVINKKVAQRKLVTESDILSEASRD